MRELKRWASLSEHFENGALEVAGFRHGEQDRVVEGLPADLEDAQLAAAGLGRLDEHLPEPGVTEMIGAGAADQNPTWFEEQQGAAIEVGVAFQGLGETAPGLGKRRRIEDDQVKGAFLRRFKKSEGLFLLKPAT